MTDYELSVDWSKCSHAMFECDSHTVAKGHGH